MTRKVRSRVRRIRQLARGSNTKKVGGPDETLGVLVFAAETHKEARRRRGGQRAKPGEGRGGRYAVVGQAHSSYSRNPVEGIAKSIRDALDPVKAPGKVKTFAEMTPEEQAEMKRLYERGGEDGNQI